MIEESKKTKTQLFLKLAKPNIKGVSRWVNVSEFVGEYSSLGFGNGASWARKESNLAKKYIIEFDKSLTAGNSIDRIRLNGFNKAPVGMQTIRGDIWKEVKRRRCVILGTSNPEVDHKNGWKNDAAVRNLKNQKLSDFQALSKAANDAKRQFCKECRSSKHRYDAKRLGYPISYYSGGEMHDGSANGCVGCFWYDPVEFRHHLKSIEE